MAPQSIEFQFEKLLQITYPPLSLENTHWLKVDQIPVALIKAQLLLDLVKILLRSKTPVPYGSQFLTCGVKPKKRGFEFIPLIAREDLSNNFQLVGQK